MLPCRYENGRIIKHVDETKTCGITVNDATYKDTGKWECILSVEHAGQAVSISVLEDITIGVGKYVALQYTEISSYYIPLKRVFVIIFTTHILQSVQFNHLEMLKLQVHQTGITPTSLQIRSRTEYLEVV